jgi:tetratricopeptide (TPR) repeat protein/transcriptional regulator with XRE-family HTH domain
MFGAQVRAHRQRLGMSQEDLAACAGVSVRTIRNLEAGRTERPRPGTVRLLADALELAAAERDRFGQSALKDTDQREAGVTVDGADTGPARSLPVPAQLPADIPGFVGRTDQLNRLSTLLGGGNRPAAVVISAIAGMAGIGKTTLAVHWARRVADRFPDGQLYVNLRGFDPAGPVATPAGVVRSFLEALGVPAQRVPAGLDAQAALYRSLLAERRMLVLLDNARDADQVRPLLPGAPGCLVLVTSRHQLTGLVAGAGAVPLPLDLLSPDEARDLLGQRVGVDRVTAEPAAVDEIINRCARLPLALAIVAARAAAQPGLPLAALGTELAHSHDRLDSLATGDPGTDVRSVFSWSYQQLSGPAARLFRLLGVHPGPDLSTSAAASLAGIPPARVRRLLAELERAHLVSERVRDRYTLHDLLRAYAAEMAASGEPHADRQAAVRRLLDHYLRSADRADAVRRPARDVIELIAPMAGVTVDEVASMGAATEWLTTEYQVLMAAVPLAVDAGLDRHAWQLVRSMSMFINRRDARDAVGVHQVALQAAGRLGDPAAQAHSHLLLGQAYTLRGEPDRARANLEHALEVYRRLGDDDNQARVHHGLLNLLDRQGRHLDALHHAEQALDRYRTTGHRAGQATGLNGLGWCHARLGNYETALKYCKQALGLHQELGDHRGEADTWDSLGLAYRHLGRHADAVAAYEQSLALLRDLGDRYFEADALVCLGETYDAHGDTAAARDCWLKALAILTDLDQPDADQVRARLCKAT